MNISPMIDSLIPSRAHHLASFRPDGFTGPAFPFPPPHTPPLSLHPPWHAYLLHLPLVPLVRARHVVGQSLGASEVMIRAGGGDDVALAGDLAGEAGDGAGDLVNLAEEENTRESPEARGWVVRDRFGVCLASGK